MNRLAGAVSLLVGLVLLPATLLGQSPAYWPEVSPDGHRILFVSPKRGGPLYVMDDDGSNVHRVIAGTRAAWLPDGEHVLVVLRLADGPRIAVTDVAGTRVDTLPGTYESPLWRPRPSPGGDTLVFGSPSKNVFHLVGRDGTAIRDIHPSAKGECSEPTWSHDGRIAFVAFRKDSTGEIRSTGLLTMASDGSGERLVATLPHAAQWISWSPDDREIALQDDDLEEHDGNILVVDVATGAVRRITHHDRPVLDETPSWSTDGRIYFQSNRSGAFAIYRMDTDGSDQERVLPSPGREVRGSPRR